MAPKKKPKQGASSSSSATFDSSRFWNEEATKVHATFFKKGMPHERGFDLSQPEYPMILEAKRRQWDEFIQQSPDAVKPVVREFYANLKVRHDNFRVLVRGKMVAFDSHTINTLYKMPDIAKDEYSKYMADHLDYSEIIRELCCEGAGWRMTNSEPITFLTADMFRAARFWFFLEAARMMPTSHTSEVTRDRAALVYAIVKQKSIDVGKIIQASVLHAVSRATTGGLLHASLITILCQSAGVTWDSEEEVLPVLDPLVVCPSVDGISHYEDEKRRAKRVARRSRPPPLPASSSSAPRTQSERLDLIERQMAVQTHKANVFMDYMINFTTVLAQ